MQNKMNFPAHTYISTKIIFRLRNDEKKKIVKSFEKPKTSLILEDK